MFNSQKINNDPEPYEVYVNHQATGVRARADDEVTVGFDCDLDLSFKPRPEFDNNPNPVLESLRRTLEDFPPIDRKKTIEHWEYMVWSDLVDPEPEGHEVRHLEHASKVLTRLVNIYGTEQ